MTGRKEVFLQEILGQAPRILGQQCRVPTMRPYGCFDRPFWNYGDYGTPRTRRQEAVLTLALLYTIQHEDNIYFGNRMILEWIRAGIDFYSRIQLRTGAFNELYPNEFNYTSTAFTSYAVSESLILLKDELPARQAYMDTLRKAAAWLSRNGEPLVINHDTGAVIFLYNMYALTGEEKYAKLAETKFEHIAKSQDPEGWFNEYGGPDIGYLSLSMDYLAKYYRKSGNERVLPVLMRAVDFISHFIHPNNTYGGEYASRNTEYLMPDAFEILAPHSETANAIAEVIADAIRGRSAVTPFALDDKFLLYNGYDYLQAYNDNRFETADTGVLPCNRPFFKYFENSRIAVRNDDRIYAIANGNKGGALYAYFKRSGRSLDDSGVLAHAGDRMLTSCLMNKTNEVEAVENAMRVRGTLGKPFNNEMTEPKYLALRLFMMTFGYFESVSLGVKEFLRKILITRSKSSASRFEREIVFDAETMTIIDRVERFGGLKRIRTGLRLDTIYGEVCRFFKNAELDGQPYEYEVPAGGRAGGTIEITRVFDDSGGMIRDSSGEEAGQ
ncbi:MAG: hypothetical protein JW876_00550 [Candidatus Krumholzibacteriota bacterium]|nr:hypothetical protein [Candidatus Krumholzibacteriota bacterium]